MKITQENVFVDSNCSDPGGTGVVRKTYLEILISSLMESFSIKSKIAIGSVSTENLVKKGEDGGLTNFLITFFDFAYYLGTSPFRFSRDSDGNYCIRKWWFQQVLHVLTLMLFSHKILELVNKFYLSFQIVCGLFHTLCAIRLCTEVRLGLHELQLGGEASPVQIFENVMNIFTFCYKMTTMKRFWFNQQQYLEILRVSKEKFSTPLNSLKADKVTLRYLNAFGTNYVKAY